MRKRGAETIDSLACVILILFIIVLIGTLYIRPLLVTFLVRDSVSCNRLRLWRVVYPSNQVGKASSEK
jgi:hypothetical protein